MKEFFVILATFAFVACGGNKAQKDCCAEDTICNEEGQMVVCVNEKTADDSDFIQKHTESYVLKRMDLIYSRYKEENVKHDEFGNVEINREISYDSMFCSSRYNKLFDEAYKICVKETDILLDYDHWTRSQDDGDFKVKQFKVKDITDSTAVAIVEATNFNHKTVIRLSLCYERGDWYIDDFLNEGGSEGEQAYFREYIEKYGEKK